MVDPLGTVRLLCVAHTCGITRARVPERFFYNFFRAAHPEVSLDRRRDVVLGLGLNIWISISEFGPRDYVCWVPVSWSFDLEGRFRRILGFWVGVGGGVEVHVVDVREEVQRPEGVEIVRRVSTEVLRNNLRAWCRQRGDTHDSMVLSRGETRLQLGNIVPVIHCCSEPRSDVSVVALNLFVSHVLPGLEGSLSFEVDDDGFVNHDWLPEA